MAWLSRVSFVQALRVGQDVMRAGMLRLPPTVSRKWRMLDGHAYVVEVRQGDSYRASVIEHVEPPEADADRFVQAVAAGSTNTTFGDSRSGPCAPAP